MLNTEKIETAREELSRFISENRPSVAYTTEQWVEMAKKVAPQYDYSKVEYRDKHTKVTIICPKHGEFLVNPKYFLWKNCECPKCREEKRKIELRNDFIKRAKKVHGDRYDYSKVEYKTSFEKVCIICPKHGEFWQNMGNHINNKCICPKCAIEESSEKRKMTTEELLLFLKRKMGDKYDYSKVVYNGYDSPVELICHKKDKNGNEHGAFTHNAHSFFNRLYNCDCPKCNFEKEGYGRRFTKEEFVNRANIIHSFKYDYSKFEYINGKTKSIIICPIHGEFLQNGESHLAGQGCPLCKTSHLELSVISRLTSEQVNFERQKRFLWLSTQSLDIYIPEINLGIECQGQQHYREVFYHSKKWTKEKAKKNFEEITERDQRKRNLCKENNIELIYFLEPKFEKYEMSGNRYFTNAEDLINYIKERKKDSVT